MRAIRDSEREARQRAYAAASEAVETGKSGRSLSRKYGLPLGSVNFSILVLKLGTPDESAALKSGDRSIAELYDAVRARVTPDEIRQNKSSRLSLARPEQFRDVRIKALAAADAVRAENLSFEDAAIRFGVGRRTINDAHTVLLNSAPDVIEQVRNGKLSLRVAYMAVRARGGVQVTKKTVRSVGSKEKDRADAAIWKRLRTALDAVRGLPSPPDVVAIARRNSQRRNAVDASLLIVATWLEEFSDAWTKD